MTTKEICALLDISPAALRLYEKYNRAARYTTASNNYREFPFESIAQLMGLRCLLNLGTTLKESSIMTEIATISTLLEEYAQRQKHLEKTIAHAQSLLAATKEQKDYIAALPNLLDSFEPVDSPAFWHLDFEKARAGSGKRWGDEVRKWSREIPIVFYAPIIKYPIFNEDIVPHIGFGIDETSALFLNICSNSWTTHYPSRKCIKTVSHVSYSHSIERNKMTNREKYYSVVQRGLDYLRDNGFALTGDIQTRLIATNIHDASQEDADIVNDYYQIWFPID